jgi:sugar/nucleoside kinase (ribokinase family)
VDVVSENGTRFASHVPPALKYADYCVINEFEAEKTTDIVLRDSKNKLIFPNIRMALEKLKGFGVTAWTVIHSPEGGFGFDSGGGYEEVPSLDVPEGYIKGTVGAGDAFCAGVIYGACTGLSLGKSLEMGTAAATCSLSEPGATEGMCPAEEAMALYRNYRSKPGQS